MTTLATFNVNGVNGRLPVLLRWLAETESDVVCLQELKTSDEKFPEAAITEAGFHSIWHGQKSYNGVAILARGTAPIERRRGLPGDPDDTHSRYLEAQVGDLIVGCLYLPNGNPAPGPKFEYKMRWFERLLACAGAAGGWRAGRAGRRLQRGANGHRCSRAWPMGLGRGDVPGSANSLCEAPRTGLDRRSQGHPP